MVDRNDRCPCGSGVKYKKCCLNKEDQLEKSSKLPIQLKIEQLISKGVIKQCIHPEQEKCSDKIVKAHSIQNNKILNKISTNGNVVMFGPEWTKKGFRFKAKIKGRKVASTFSGFCGYHDKIIFQPIEDYDYEESTIQNFLFSYRSFSYEYHRKNEADNTGQIQINSKLILAKNDKYTENITQSEAGIEDATFIYYKSAFDEAILQDNFSLVETFCIRLQGEALVAVCSGFFLEYDLSGKRLNDATILNPQRFKLLMFNLFPQNNETIVLFSWLQEDSIFYQEFKNKLLELSIAEQINFLNNLIVSYCENTTVNPKYFNNLTYHEKSGLLDDFRSGFSILDDMQKRNLLRESKCNLFKNIKIV